ncbi:Upstream activation factor subunit spp27 [Morus notabilis]|uniref:Upstream activation factor subunit spp27 n=1 Tax=Morus notabilis TaxID=981085 RepID=W9RBI2_9ROSA|nr:Upstream activation factor subunit spp27 [Morus notabilis]
MKEEEEEEDAMVTDQEISQALQTLIREASVTGGGVTTLNGVVQQLESKLGYDLSHKADFIGSQIQLIGPQIQLIFRSHTTQPQRQQQHHHQQQAQLNDRFAPHQNPNFQPSPSAFQTFPFQPPPTPLPAPKTEPAAAADDVVSPSERPKESTQTKAKRKGGPGGLNKLCGVSPELQAIVGQPALPRTEIVKQLWAYIRRNNLQDPSNKRKIICNEELRVVFETDCTDMFKMNKLLAKHIIPLEPTKQSVAKKPKVKVESGANSTESSPSVVISEALANFFGVGGSEMLQADVFRRIWEYIKVNNLEAFGLLPKGLGFEPPHGHQHDISHSFLPSNDSIVWRRAQVWAHKVGLGDFWGEKIAALTILLSAWTYTQDPLNKMVILCDAKLQELFGCESISGLEIQEVLARHHIFRKT